MREYTNNSTQTTTQTTPKQQLTQTKRTNNKTQTNQGHYAPAVAHRVYRAKELGLGLPINIKGVAIGNGLTMPALQFGAYADFAQQAGLISEKVRAAAGLRLAEGSGGWGGGGAGRSRSRARAAALERTARLHSNASSPTQPHATPHNATIATTYTHKTTQHYNNAQRQPQTRDSINWWLPPCRWGARLCNAYKWSWLCGLTLQYCQLAIFQRILMAKPGVNVYDVRKECDGPLCYDFSAADAYLNSKGVRDALGVGRREWSECNMLVHAGFTGARCRGGWGCVAFWAGGRGRGERRAERWGWRGEGGRGEGGCDRARRARAEGGREEPRDTKAQPLTTSLNPNTIQTHTMPKKFKLQKKATSCATTAPSSSRCSRTACAC